MRMLPNLIRDRRGTSTIELALLTPLFALLMLGTVDAARAVSEKMRLQQAAARTIELATAGGINAANLDSLKSEGAAAANVEPSDVTADRWLECDRVRQDSFEGSCGSTEEVARFVSIAINASYRPWFSTSLAGLGYNVSPDINLRGKSSVRLQ